MNKTGNTKPKHLFQYKHMAFLVNIICYIILCMVKKSDKKYKSLKMGVKKRIHIAILSFKIKGIINLQQKYSEMYYQHFVTRYSKETVTCYDT